MSEDQLCLVCGTDHRDEPWRDPLGALRLTLWGDPRAVDVERAQAEVEELTRVLNEHPPVPAVTQEGDSE